MSAVQTTESKVTFAMRIDIPKRAPRARKYLIAAVVPEFVVTTEGLVPIVTMFDRWGDETDVFAEAVSVVAGPTHDRRWLALPMPDQRLQS